MKVDVANSCSLADCCQFRNVIIDFVKYLTASESNVKIILLTTYQLFSVFSLLPASSRSNPEAMIHIERFYCNLIITSMLQVVKTIKQVFAHLLSRHTSKTAF